ncbi:hypothetical protein Pfo_004349, partial [Paulownia fortunei]
MTEMICSYPGSTALHLAARGGSLDCVHELLLAWGAHRLQKFLAIQAANAELSCICFLCWCVQL